VTGEANLITKNSGDKVFAGGKQMGIIEMEVLNSVSKLLNTLWSNDVFQRGGTQT
jgi:Cu+-exporting ATPase